MSNSKQVPGDHLAEVSTGHKASQVLKDSMISLIKAQVEEVNKVIHLATCLKNSRNSLAKVDNKEVLLEKLNNLKLKVRT